MLYLEKIILESLISLSNFPSAAILNNCDATKIFCIRTIAQLLCVTWCTENLKTKISDSEIHFFEPMSTFFVVNIIFMGLKVIYLLQSWFPLKTNFFLLSVSFRGKFFLLAKFIEVVFLNTSSTCNSLKSIVRQI